MIQIRFANRTRSSHTRVPAHSPIRARPKKMTPPSIVRTILLAVLLSLLAATSASAQSFFEKLFGFGASKTEEHRQLPPPMPSYRAPIQMPQPRASSSFEDDSTPHVSGTVRTVCVRTCDGYYFPISQSTSGRNLNADNARCKATCGSDARLFYSTNQSEPDIASMIDLTGRRYDAMNTAFAYRKALRPGCSCRPPPWSSAEQQRHFKYKLEEAQQEMMAVAASDVTLDGKPIPLPQTMRAENNDNDTETAEVVAAAQPERSATLQRRQERHNPPSTTARTTPRPQQQDRYSKAGSSTGFGGLFGMGQQQKQVWPGDAR